MSHSTAIRHLLLQGEPLSAREIGRQLGISQPTISRTLRGELFEETQSIGAGRGSLYGLRHMIGKHGYNWPVYQISERGQRIFLGNLTSLAGDNWLIQLEESAPALYRRQLPKGLSEGWPWFLDGLRPQGFMGRAFAKQYHQFLGASDDLLRWTSDEYLLSALLFGKDLPGNLLIGEATPESAKNLSESQWKESALRSVEGVPIGSSAGGERPKFTSGQEIVKFSINTGLDGRWSDLLVAEHLANEVLRQHGIPAAHSRLVEREGFTFLAVKRFDRMGTSGRRAVHSLEAIDQGFIGDAGSTWIQMVDRLLADKLIPKETAQQVRTIWSFGRAIGNTDMHLGNLSFFIDKDDRFKLAPVYDMLPMRYAPTAVGLPRPESTGFQHPFADVFWERVREDSRVSDTFREVAEANLVAG